MTEQSLVERVDNELKRIFAPAIDARAPYAKVMFREAARAAIAAMREPTGKMKEAAWGLIEDVALKGPEYEGKALDGHVYDDSPLRLWRVMIDMALAEGQTDATTS